MQEAFEMFAFSFVMAGQLIAIAGRTWLPFAPPAVAETGAVDEAAQG